LFFQYWDLNSGLTLAKKALYHLRRVPSPKKGKGKGERERRRKREKGREKEKEKKIRAWCLIPVRG
jgi:hypothetical protein